MILDTSVLVELDRGLDKEKAVKLDNLGPHKISSVTVSEFYAGVHIRTGSGEGAAEKLLSKAEEVGMEGQIARKAGELIAKKKEEDMSLNINDIYIAATALFKGEKVLTKDSDDFEQVDSLEVVKWEEI